MFAETTSKVYTLTESVMNEVAATLILPETGGILGCESNDVINHFHHDATGTSTKKIYVPDIIALNKVIADWHTQGIKFVGFIHSHSAGKKFLSRLDIKYAQKIKSYCAMSEVLMAIYLPADKTFHQYCI